VLSVVFVRASSSKIPYSSAEARNRIKGQDRDSREGGCCTKPCGEEP
jgi:hypothetical protein